MASILKPFHDILCQLRFTRGFVRHIFRRWILFLAFLGRRLGVWRPWSDRKRGTFQKAEKAERSSPGTGTILDPREYVVAASYIPASASHPSLHNTSSASGQPQPATASGATPPPPANLTAEPPSHRDHANHSSDFEARIHPNRRSTDSSIRSRSNDRLSIIQAYPRESVHTPVSRPTQFPRALSCQSGVGTSASPSRERPSRSPSPTDRLPLPRLGIDVTNPLTQTHVDGRNSSTNASLVASHAHAPLSPTSTHGHRGGQSSTSVVAGVQNPLTDSLPLSPSTDRPPLMEEPYIIGSLSGHPSPVSGVLDPRDGLPQRTPTTSSSSATSDFDIPDGRFLQLIHSEQVPRYIKDVTVQVDYNYTTAKPLSLLAGPRVRTCYEIPPLTRTFPHISEQMIIEQGSLMEDCAPWAAATHPDGALYFFDGDRRLFTDTDMHDPVLREEMEDFYHYLQKILDHEGIVIPSKNYDLMLDIMPSGDGQILWSYYYACHETRCLFWLDPYDATHMISELFGVKSPAHVKHRLEDLYWTHWSLFPAAFESRRMGHAVVDELVGILSHGCMDRITSKSSTQPFDVDTMQKMLEFVRNAKGLDKESDACLVYHTTGITRLLSHFAHWRFLDFHGQTSARLIGFKTVYTRPGIPRTLLITSLSPVLFFAPEGYLRLLEMVRVDEVINEEARKDFISRLLKEWEQLILSSTVMLSVNVGFLAIPGVVVSNLNSNITGTNQVVIFTSPAQIASCMSIVASAGSIVIGLLLVRRSGPQQNEDPSGASFEMYRSSDGIFGLEPLAIIFSLPWALVMWSMATFFVALLLFCFDTNSSTRIFVAVTSVALAILVGWCIKRGSIGSMMWWFNALLPFITYALNNAYATCHRILALIDFIFRRESPSAALGNTGGVPTMPDREGVGVVV